ncbi:MAG: heavy-metal-associated domain-containing protein [Sphingomonadales bacterium]|nr:heavy-metal-associated domain-containing protein [Sphingomonadales bacterium]
MKLVLLPTLLFLLISCSQSGIENKKKEQQFKICKSVEANTIQEIGVKGMVCQMGCGGTIRKSLKETCAVDRVEVSYIDSLEEQKIKVYYKRERIAPRQMLGMLADLNDKQFTVRLIGAPQDIQ